MKVKSISALLVLALMLTIGGVYAVWTYAGTNDIADAFAETKVTIADVELTGANGTYKIESNLVLVVEQANNDHEARLDFFSNNDAPIYLKVTFTPAENAPQTVKDGAVPSELYFGLTTEMTYSVDAAGNYSTAEGAQAIDIFKFANSGNGVLDNVFTWEEDNGTFTYTLDEAALRAQIMLNEEAFPGGKIVLDTKTEHDAFRAALTGNIVARVTDGTVNTNTVTPAN